MLRKILSSVLIIVMAASLLVGISNYDHVVNTPMDRSTQHVKWVYHRLVINAGQTDIPDLQILDDHGRVPNAWTDGQGIFITKSLLAIMQNDDQLALVLGHEMAHYINHDVYHSDMDQATVEAHADKLGALLMMRAGFDICNGREMFRIFKANFGDTSLASDHPDFAYRYDQLDLPMCSSIFYKLGEIIHV